MSLFSFQVCVGETSSTIRAWLAFPGPARGSTVIRGLGLALALAAVLGLAAPAAALAAPELLPDLVADPPVNPHPLEVTRLADGQNHLLVRFDGTIHNIGAGPLEIRGSRPVNGTMTVTGQRIYRQDSTFYDDDRRHPPIHYENSDGHRHWHLKGAARYSLWREDGTAPVAIGAKVGFCLLDSERADSFAAPRVYTKSATQYCREGQPNAAQVFEGISRGWVDLYSADLPFQWVDLSDVVPGHYRLGAEMDPDNFVRESNEGNNGPALGGTVIVPGYAAAPATASVTEGQAVTIALATQAFGAPGQRELRIQSGPRYGTLNVPVGVPLAAAEVVYAPAPGFTGVDSFTFSTRDTASPYPLHSSAAAATVAVSPKASRRSRPPLLTRLRFRRRGRVVRLRAVATTSGVLRVLIKKRTRRLGSCRRRARAGHRFTCRIRLRRRTSLSGARAIVTLRVDGKAAAVDTFRLPRRLRR